MRIEEISARADAATPAPWRWVDAYEFHEDHIALGLDADCENIREGRITLESPTGEVLKKWVDLGGGDSGLTISIEDARLIQAARSDIPNLVAALREVLKVEHWCEGGNGTGDPYEACSYDNVLAAIWRGLGMIE